MKNKYIDTYSTVYDIDIVVANKYVTIEDLKDTYCYSDKVELDEFLTNGIATTATCINKKNNRRIILVKYNKDTDDLTKNKKLDIINTAAHEATHVLLDIYASIEQQSIITNDSNEPVCYMIGYITECIMNTWTKK